jgi:hypothetical protein
MFIVPFDPLNIQKNKMKMSQIFSFFRKHSLNVLLIVLSFTYLPCYYCERNLIFIWLGYYKKKQKNKQTTTNQCFTMNCKLLFYPW